jgi:hypothetical protein
MFRFREEHRRIRRDIQVETTPCVKVLIPKCLLRILRDGSIPFLGQIRVLYLGIGHELRPSMFC